jgi:hypothetical protein
MAIPEGKEGLVRKPTKKTGRREPMSFQILLAALCAVIAANIFVAVIAILRAYREEAYLEAQRFRRASSFTGFAPR